MAWTTPHTWVSGETVTAALMNTHVRDNLATVFPGGTGWTDVTFAAGDFTANGSMTWTVASGDVASYRWTEIGKTMIVSVWLNTTTVGGTVNSELRVAVPNGRTIGSTSQSYAGSGAAMVVDNGVHRAASWAANPGVTYVSIQVAFGGNWTLSTNNTYIAATFVFPIV